MSVEIGALSPDTAEGLIKDRMAELLPRCKGGVWTREYVELARSLREISDEHGERRVPVIDWPTDDGQLWQDIGVTIDYSDGYDYRAAPETGGRSA